MIIKCEYCNKEFEKREKVILKAVPFLNYFCEECILKAILKLKEAKDGKENM